MARFGEDVKDPLEKVRELGERLRMKRSEMSGFTQAQLFADLYNETYDIADVSSTGHPLASVMMVGKENVRYYSPLYNRFRTFLSLGGEQTLHMSFREFISYPRDMVHFLIELFAPVVKKSQENLQKTEDQLNKKQ